MRLMSGDIRLLVADEPTSALDPEGEFELFTRLREHSGGKTVVFITLSAYQTTQNLSFTE